MVKCSAINCESSSHKKIQGISFHRFPKDITLRRLWIVNMKRETWKPKSNSLLCSKHFENQYLDTSQSYYYYHYGTSKSCTKLRPGAVPTLFEQVSESEELLSPPKKRVKTMVPVLRDIQNVSEDSCICQECFLILQNVSMNPTGDFVERTYGHQQVCLGCGKSILRAKTHIVPLDSPERDLIISCIPIQQGSEGSESDGYPPRPEPKHSRSVTPITDPKEEGPEDEEAEMSIEPSEEKDYTIVIQDRLSQTIEQGSFKQLHSHRPGAGHSQLYVQPSTSTSEPVIKEEVDEEFLDYKAMYYNLLEEVTTLKNQQLYQENQALIETNKNIVKNMENLIEANQKYAIDMQQLMSENQRLQEKNQSLAENIQYLSDRIQELTAKNEIRTRERVDIFSEYIEKIENLNEKIRSLTEDNKSLTERNKTLAESVRKYSEESRSFEMKNKLQRRFILRLNNSFNNKLETKSRVIKALRQNVMKLEAVNTRLRRLEVASLGL